MFAMSKNEAEMIDIGNEQMLILTVIHVMIMQTNMCNVIMIVIIIHCYSKFRLAAVRASDTKAPDICQYARSLFIRNF